jgi:phosphoglycerol transferase MdoB-like AlkP superfamily enzyme
MAAPRPDAVRRGLRLAVRVAVGLVLPTAIYYLLRAAGASVYVSLVASAVVSAGPGAVSVVRHRRVDGLSAYFSAMTVGALLVSLVPGGVRLLLAKEAVLTAVTGVWFLASIRSGRPLAYLFTRPLLEGRFHWPAEWDRLWGVSPRFRRMWRVSSLLYGIGLLVDAGARVVMAYRLPPDRVPALALALYGVVMVVLWVVTNVYYVRCGVHDRRSAMYPAQFLGPGEPVGRSVISTSAPRRGDLA